MYHAQHPNEVGEKIKLMVYGCTQKMIKADDKQYTLGFKEGITAITGYDCITVKLARQR